MIHARRKNWGQSRLRPFSERYMASKSPGIYVRLKNPPETTRALPKSNRPLQWATRVWQCRRADI